MLLKEFNKKSTPDLKNKWEKYGNKLIRTIIDDIRKYNRNIDKSDRCASKNIIHIESLLKQTVGYITSYYIKASENLESNADIVNLVGERWEYYEKDFMELLSKDNKTNKDKQMLVAKFLILGMCRACADNYDFISSYVYHHPRNTERLTKELIEAVGYPFFINELYTQCYILTIFKSLLHIKTMENRRGIKFRGKEAYDNFMYDTIFNSKVGNFNLSLQKSRLFRKMKEFKYMKFTSSGLNYGKMFMEIFRTSNDMSKSLDEVSNFMINMNKCRVGNKDISIHDIRLIGGF